MWKISVSYSASVEKGESEEGSLQDAIVDVLDRMGFDDSDTGHFIVNAVYVEGFSMTAGEGEN